MSDIGVNHRTLYEIADDLTIYFDNLELATTDEEAAEFQAQIDLMGGELVQKADNIAGVIRRINAEVALISAEEERLTERRILFEKAVAWLTAYTMRVMQERGMTQIKSPTVTLRLQGNGGVQPLLTTEELADEFKDITVKMPLELFRRSVELDDVIYQAKMVALEPSQPRIREALAKPCENCDGAGGFMDQGVDLDNPPEFNACDRCHGTGKATVAGAELKPRGYQLRIT